MSLNQIGVLNPSNLSQADGATVTALAGKSAETILAELHGKFYTACYRGMVFTFNVTGQTLPVIASGLVSKFAVFNGAGTGKNMELICADYGTVSATTVVDIVGLYYSGGALALASTFTTAGTALSGMIGASAANACIPYSTLTHSGTPTRHTLIGYFGATSTTSATPCHYDFDGRAIVPTSTVISIAMSTAASTATSFDVGLTWAEIPV